LFCNFVATFYLCALMKLHINWDALGISATLACAIHCALLPLLMSSLPLFGINIIHNLFFEAGMIAAAAVIGGYSLWHGYRRHHHNLFPFFIFFGGMLCLILKQFVVEFHYWLLIPAVVFIISAHLLNWKLCRRAKHCHNAGCTH
jgi:hypothetical protein